MQWKQLLLKFHYYATSWIIHWEDELWRIIKILPGSFSVCYTRCFPVCCKWVDLGLCHLFLFSRLSFTFLSLYLFFSIYSCVLPLASFAPPILCLLFVESIPPRTFFKPHCFSSQCQILRNFLSVLTLLNQKSFL